jgi:tetratricopeptide (TPR) repeat protein
LKTRRIVAAVAAGLALFRLDAAATPRCEGRLPRVQIEEQQEETLKLLRGRKFDELQARMDERLAAYVAGRLTDEELFYEFGAFDRWGPFLTPLFEEWIAKFPRSYAAHQGMALHRQSMAHSRRGSGYASETSPQQWGEFFRLMDDARDWARKATALHPRPILSHGLLVFTARGLRAWEVGDEPQRSLEASLRLQPDNIVVRKAWVELIEPRWGGSIAQLEAYAKPSAHPGLPPDRMAAVAYEARMEIAAEYRRLERHDAAVRHYEKAAALCRLNQPWMEISMIRRDQRRFDDALKAADKAVEIYPGSRDGMRLQAEALNGLGRYDECFKILTRLAPGGSAAVLYMLGEFYAHGVGGAQRDMAEARRLFQLAAQGGEARAAERLKYLGGR